MDFEYISKAGIIVIVVLLASLIGMATYDSISRAKTESAYKDMCTKAGGVFIDGNGMDFCVKEFMPLQGDK